MLCNILKLVTCVYLDDMSYLSWCPLPLVYPSNASDQGSQFTEKELVETGSYCALCHHSTWPDRNLDIFLYLSMCGFSALESPFTTCYFSFGSWWSVLGRSYRKKGLPAWSWYVLSASFSSTHSYLMLSQDCVCAAPAPGSPEGPMVSSSLCLEVPLSTPSQQFSPGSKRAGLQQALLTLHCRTFSDISEPRLCQSGCSLMLSSEGEGSLSLACFVSFPWGRSHS
jgi:hypothetical protein